MRVELRVVVLILNARLAFNYYSPLFVLPTTPALSLMPLLPLHRLFTRYQCTLHSSLLYVGLVVAHVGYSQLRYWFGSCICVVAARWAFPAALLFGNAWSRNRHPFWGAVFPLSFHVCAP